jgi:hypothetical protein
MSDFQKRISNSKLQIKKQLLENSKDYTLYESVWKYPSKPNKERTGLKDRLLRRRRG